jgi:type IV pilus assembly protein PilV
VKALGSRTITLSNQEGFTLIESMLSLAIIAVGLLALAGMQSISLGRNIDANQLSQVTNLAADMMERIQFNRRNVLAYASTSPDPVTQPMAAGDFAQWQARLVASGVPGITGQVTVTPMGPAGLNQNQVVVTVTWNRSMNSETSRLTNTALRLTSIVAPE